MAGTGQPVVADVLNRVHYVHGVANERLARLANVSASTMTRARDGSGDLRAADVQLLSHALCGLGITDLAQAMLSPEFVVCRRGEGRVSGCLSDESAAAVKALASVLNAYERGDVDAGRAAATSLKPIIDNLLAEFDALATGSRPAEARPAEASRAASGAPR